ncbi:hypothetical protein GZ78_00725 [Endozoicomonas numazuensis]|uniref:Aminoglycoside phosphotransferase domain-containing protein n=2 Tax=Endozoicomonas numazuensis TaxID=1137799 RepID=A0A081NJQ7_9GAMM|nr:hypothetical protein GZ78_00725 [Endozoicomonas numazuensis]
MHSHLVSAEFVELPKVPDFSVLQTYEEAIHRLFQGRGEDFRRISTDGGEIDQAYTVLFDEARWFVKIVREDCTECHLIRFENEWLLKKSLSRYRWLAKVNAQLVLPDRAATFILNRKQHYILSYPLVPGSTLRALYYQLYLASPYALNIKQKRLLRRAFFRYGQVLALSHFDPKLPAKDSAEMLSRVVRLHLPDRSGSNEIYDPVTDRIYLVDLADTAQHFGKSVKVSTDLQEWLESLVDIAMDARERDGFYCGLSYECIVNPLKQFTLGYASSLPLYKRKMVMAMMGETVTAYLQKVCVSDTREISFCPAVGIIEQQFHSY